MDSEVSTWQRLSKGFVGAGLPLIFPQVSEGKLQLVYIASVDRFRDGPWKMSSKKKSIFFSRRPYQFSIKMVTKFINNFL